MDRAPSLQVEIPWATQVMLHLIASFFHWVCHYEERSDQSFSIYLKVFLHLAHLKQMFRNRKRLPHTDWIFWAYMNTAIALGCKTKQADHSASNRSLERE